MATPCSAPAGQSIRQLNVYYDEKHQQIVNPCNVRDTLVHIQTCSEPSNPNKKLLLNIVNVSSGAINLYEVDLSNAMMSMQIQMGNFFKEIQDDNLRTVMNQSLKPVFHWMRKNPVKEICYNCIEAEENLISYPMITSLHSVLDAIEPDKKTLVALDIDHTIIGSWHNKKANELGLWVLEKDIFELLETIKSNCNVKLVLITNAYVNPTKLKLTNLNFNKKLFAEVNSFNSKNNRQIAIPADLKESTKGNVIEEMLMRHRKPDERFESIIFVDDEPDHLFSAQRTAEVHKIPIKNFLMTKSNVDRVYSLIESGKSDGIPEEKIPDYLFGYRFPIFAAHIHWREFHESIIDATKKVRPLNERCNFKLVPL